ncbi:MAG: NUDIX domain-containing protein [Candidatus Hydrogenedentes bacterium]|nr:NUDIX domain-containing protein [Candidatus Hydrogenedentota bacterium]
MSASSGPRIRVAAVIFQDDKVLLVRHEKEGRSYWLLPGGGVDFGESLHEALIRELREEVQIDIEPGPLVLANDTLPPDRHRHIVHLYFMAKIISGTPKRGSDPRVVEVAYVQVKDLPRITLFPDVGEAIAHLANSDTSPTYLGNLWQP